MEIIVPAAGLSTRFPEMKPKYLLYDYKHDLMLKNSLRPYLQNSITVGILKEHDEKYHASEFIRYEFGDKIKIVVLEKPTKGPADTVYQIIQKSGLTNEEILIKDCDSFFEHEISPGNYVCVSKISEHEILKKLSSKSFTISNEQGIINDIIEKKVVSDTFCVGGYKFESALLYKNAFEDISQEREIFVSDVIGRCINNKNIFTEKAVKNYIDVGTAKDWFEYNDKPVIFCDIDGTIVKAQSRVGENSYDHKITPLTKNVKKLLEMQSNGAQFIFTTSRGKIYDERSCSLLNELGFKNYTLISGLQNSRRILINDFNKSNPFPRAEAINIFRDSDDLENYL